MVKKYTCNDCFFSECTAEALYWAGFIAADGCVRDNSGKYIRIGLAKKDHNHIRKFRDAVKYSGKIHSTSWGDFLGSYIVVSSDRMFEDLKRFNVFPRKTKTYSFPSWLISHPLVCHFMRGYSDGDGSFYITNRDNRATDQICFEICGTENFIKNYKLVLEEKCNITLGKIRNRNNGLFSIQCKGNKKVLKIYNFLYYGSDTNTRLDRKFKLASNFFNRLNPYIREKGVVGVCGDKKILFNSIKSVSKCGFTPSAVSACCRGVRKTHMGFSWSFQKETGII